MTDRFYPVGLEAVEDAFKTTYEIANEMRSYPRSDFPPGTSVHLPGTMDKFGYSNPGPVLSRLTKKKDDHSTYFVPKSMHTLGEAKLNPLLVNKLHKMDRAKSSPLLMNKLHKNERVSVPFSSEGTGFRTQSGLTEVFPQGHYKDDHFTYFVPKSMHSLGEAKLNPLLMSKLHKTDRVSFPFSGEGTGFRTQSGLTEVFPQGHYKDVTTTTKLTFKKPPIVRLSPLDLH